MICSGFNILSPYRINTMHCRICRDRKNGYTWDKKGETLIWPWHMVVGHFDWYTQSSKLFFSKSIDAYLCPLLINLIVLLYTNKSVSFQLCFHIFFFHKSIKIFKKCSVLWSRFQCYISFVRDENVPCHRGQESGLVPKHTARKRRNETFLHPSYILL